MASRVERVKGVKQVRAIRARAIISVGGRLAKRDSGGGEAAVGEAAVNLREAGVSREELSIARHEGDARTRIKDAISSSSNRPLVGKPTQRPKLGKLPPCQRCDPRPHVVPNSAPRAVPASIVPRCDGSWRSPMREDTMATKAPGQRGKRKVVDVGGYDWAERPHPRTVYRIIKAPEDLGSNTRRDGAKEVAEAGGHTEAEEQVTLVRSICTRPSCTVRPVVAEEEMVEDPDEPLSTRSVALNKGRSVSIGTNRHSEHRVALGHRRAIPAQHACHGCVKWDGGVSERTDGRPESRRGGGSSARLSKGRAVESGLPRGKGQADGEEARVGERRGGVRWDCGRSGAGDLGQDGGKDGRWGKNVHIVSIGNDNPPVAQQGRDGEQHRVEPQSKELCAKRITLTSPTAREDDGRRIRACTSHIQLSRSAVEGTDPIP